MYSGAPNLAGNADFRRKSLGWSKEQLVKVSDQKPGNYADRYVIEESCPPGIRLSRNSTHSATNTTLIN